MNTSLISYGKFLKDRKNFVQSGTRGGSEFNIFDTPGHSFFKLLFYFWNDDVDNMNGGLLTPTWTIYNNDNFYNYNSAWAYLKNNDENERAEKLERFINLLSNINSESPWYFSEITGLNDAIDRPITDLKFEERKKISIKCLPDSYDKRICTLLELYRDVTWSWSMKREVIPANLRKFDMGIYIWESPIYALTTNAILDETTSNNYSASYKLLELHNCEIDYNSIKTGLESINNTTGLQSEFTIDIYFDDCYEHSYNSIMMRTIGDVIETDMYEVSIENSLMTSNIASRAQGTLGAKYNSDTTSTFSELENRINKSGDRVNNWYTNPITGTYKQGPDGSINVGYQRILPDHKGSKHYKQGLLSQIIGSATRDVKSSLQRLLLGNLYGYSVSKMASQLKSMFSGNVFTAIDAVDEYAGTNIMNTIHNNSLTNLSGRGQKLLNDKVNNRREGRLEEQPNSIGNLNEGNISSNVYNTYINEEVERSKPLNKDNLYDSNEVPKQNEIKTLGNIYKSKTLANNI